MRVSVRPVVPTVKGLIAERERYRTRNHRKQNFAACRVMGATGYFHPVQDGGRRTERGGRNAGEPR